MKTLKSGSLKFFAMVGVRNINKSLRALLHVFTI
jgi:hypothetical protein